MKPRISPIRVLRIPPKLLVRMIGLEPTLPCGNWNLNPYVILARVRIPLHCFAYQLSAVPSNRAPLAGFGDRFGDSSRNGATFLRLRPAFTPPQTKLF